MHVTENITDTQNVKFSIDFILAPQSAITEPGAKNKDINKILLKPIF